MIQISRLTTILILSSSEFLLGSTVRGLCRPEDRSNKINQSFWIGEASVNLLLCYFPSSTLVCCWQLDCLEISYITMGLVMSILVIWITNVRQLFEHQWKRQTQRQFIIVIKIIIKKSVVHLPNELNQKRSQYPYWSCNYKPPEFSLTKLSVCSLTFTLASKV